MATNRMMETAKERSFLVRRYLIDKKQSRSGEALIREAILHDSAEFQVEEHEYPRDTGDLGRSFEAYLDAPVHLQARMLPRLVRYCEHVLGLQQPNESEEA